MDEQNRNIDESWKEAVEKEKESLKHAGGFMPETPDFKFFITTLSMQAAIFLGVLEDPATNKKEENMPQAKFIIDTIDMLKEKTKGNLSREEEQLLDDILYELRVKFIAKANDGKNDDR